MEARILLAADFANVDAVGKLNILGAFNQIFTKSFPARHSLLYLVVRLVAELGEFDKERILKIILFDTDSREKWTTGAIPFRVHAPAGGRIGEFHAIIAVQNAEFEQEGRHEYRIFVNDDLKGSIPLDVVKFEQPQGG